MVLATTPNFERVMADSLFDPSASRLTPGEIGSALSGEIKSLPIVTGYYGASASRRSISNVGGGAAPCGGEDLYV